MTTEEKIARAREIAAKKRAAREEAWRLEDEEQAREDAETERILAERFARV